MPSPGTISIRLANKMRMNNVVAIGNISFVLFLSPVMLATNFKMLSIAHSTKFWKKSGIIFLSFIPKRSKIKIRTPTNKVKIKVLVIGKPRISQN